jgi:tRNA1Val (adenine37-N6)-methyltransferase
MDETSLELTRDTILGGTQTLDQPKAGYRFSLDSILLARFASARRRDLVLELGAGCGVVAIAIVTLFHPRAVVAIEIQPALARLIENNAELNAISNLRAVCADIRTRKIVNIEPGSFDLVVANPPFHASGRGRQSPNDARHLARGEGGATLEDFIKASRRYVQNGGRVAFVFSANRSAELLAMMRSNRLEPKRIRFVHPRVELPAVSMLVEARASGGTEVKIEPPLIIYDRVGVYSAEAEALLGAPANPRPRRNRSLCARRNPAAPSPGSVPRPGQ